MILSLISIAVVAGIAYVWMTRGFFSALLNMVCVLIAGAIAFAAWEPLAYLILEKAPTTGMMSGISSGAWGIGLAAPFIVALALLRLAVDKLLPANVHCNPVTNYVGGGACGAIAGVISAGILVMSLGFMRVGSELWGYKPLGYSGPGSALKKESGLLVPVDAITAGIYGRFSRTSLATAEPLDKWYARLQDVPHAMRMTYEDASRNTIQPTDFSVVAHYTLGGEGIPLASLLKDSFDDKSQMVGDLDGKDYPPDSRIAGFVVNFASGAKEKNGQVIIGPGQVRLVSQSDDGQSSIAAHPFAAISRTSVPEKVNYARFRFDGRDIYLPSVGGSSENKMAFEFIVLPGHRPLALYVKNVRYEVPAAGATAFATTAERDAAVLDGTLMKATVDQWASSDGAGGSTGQPTGPGILGEEGYRVDNRLVRVIQDGTQGPDLEVRTPYVISGEAVFERRIFDKTQGMEKSLRIDKLDVTDGTCIIWLDVSVPAKASILGKALESAEMIVPPLLKSADGQTFEPVGYWYEDATYVKFRYTRDKPIRALQELNSKGVLVTRSRSDQRLVLIFAPSFGVEITSFTIGSKTLWEPDQPIKMDQRQK